MPYHQYFNGDIFLLDAVLLKTDDLGLLRGYGFFDYFRTYNGSPFRWDDYWRRFQNSARLLHLELPISQQETAEIVGRLHALSGEKDVAFRFVLTGGYASNSLTVASPNMLIRTEVLVRDSQAVRSAGIKVLPYEYVRDLPEVKTTNYVHMMLMADEMKKQNAADLLYHKNGLVSELTRSNIFIIKDDALITPDQYVLHGVTRRVVMELAGPYMEIQVRPVLLEELLNAQEVFTTSSTKQILPVVQVGAEIIGTGAAGKHTLQLQSLFEKLTANWSGTM